MTVDVKFGTVITAIAGLSITGITIKDSNKIPENPESVLPVLFLDPDNPITDIIKERQSLGLGTALMDLSYTLNYIYLHAKIGAGLGLSAVLPGVITNTSLIIEKIESTGVVSGAVEIETGTIRIGTITGPNGKEFHGAMVSFRVKEFIQ